MTAVVYNRTKPGYEEEWAVEFLTEYDGGSIMDMAVFMGYDPEAQAKRWATAEYGGYTIAEPWHPEM